MTSNDKIIIPTIGRRVWFWPARNAGQTGFISHDDGTPMDAGIVYVWGDRMVNLDVTDHAGNHHAFTSVALAQPGDEPPRDGRYCQWMPYQMGQAKAAVVTASSGESPAPYSHRADLERGAISEIARHVVAVPHRASEVGKAVKTAIDSLLANDGPPASPSADRPTETKAYPDGTTATGLAPLPSASPIVFDLMPFSAALEYLKAGARIARAGWNGKGQFAYLVPAASYPVQTGAAAAHFGEGSVVPYRAYLALKTVDDTVSTWAPSVSDVLAEDWLVLP